MVDSPRPGLLFVSSVSVEESARNDPERWRTLGRQFRVGVLGFSDRGFTVFRAENCRFYGLPRVGPVGLRGLLYYLLVPPLTVWLALRHGLRVWVAQGPYEAGAVLVPRLVLGLPLGVRLIVEAHGDWIDSFLTLRDPPFPGMVRSLLATYSRVVLAGSDALRAVSEDTADQLRSYAPGTPLFTFPAYMDLEPFREAGDRGVGRAEEPELLYAGALTRLKGVDLLIEAAAGVLAEEPDLQLYLAGEGPARGELEALVHERNLGDRVRFLGRLSRGDLAERMARATLFVLPSRREGYGRVLVEAMAAGTPVVATRCGGPRELLEKSGAGRLVDVGDADALAAGILALLRDENERRERAENGRSFVRDHRPREAFFRGYRRIVEALVPA